MFVVKNKDLFKSNSKVHSFNARSRYDLHIPAANLAVFQNGVWYSGIKIYNHLPPTIKQLSYVISKFKAALKRFLYTNIFVHWRSIAGNRDLVFLPLHPGNTIHHCTADKLLYNSNTYAYTYKSHM